MTLCINPNCSHPKNSDDLLICSGCASKLLLEGRYRVIQMLGEGGFSKTYEVKDGARNPKVLKVLTKNSPKAIDLFKQEAEILSRFNILGIPKGKEYFTFFPANQEKPLYCFVMEKINGENLEEWMEKRNNQPIAILNDFLYISILMNFGKIKFMFLSKKLEQKFDNLKRPA
jgi:serine/threonine protein kinase